MPNFVEFDVGTGNLTPVREFIEKIKDEFKFIHPENSTILGLAIKNESR
nr:hypothetical protein KXZ65_20035 [Pectobacterium sp. PL152]